MGDPTPKPTTRPGATNKPVMPEAEPEEKPSPEIQPPANREKPLQDLDSPTEEVDLSPPKEKPKPEEVPEAHPTDIDAPPLSKPADKPASPDDDEPPPQAPSILKVPNRKPPAGEDLPAPRPDLNPNSKPKLPELLPAPTARRTSFLDAAGSRNLEPPRPSTFGTPSSLLPGSSAQPQWTPRTVRRSTDDTLR